MFSQIMTRLALKLSEKTSEPYAYVVRYIIRAKITFALLRSSILCIRGCGSLKRQFTQTEPSMNVIVEKGRFQALNNLTTSIYFAIRCFVSSIGKNIVFNIVPCFPVYMVPFQNYKHCRSRNSMDLQQQCIQSNISLLQGTQKRPMFTAFQRQTVPLMV